MTDETGLRATPEEIAAWTQRLQNGEVLHPARTRVLGLLLLVPTAAAVALSSVLFDVPSDLQAIYPAHAATNTGFAVAWIGLLLINVIVRLGLLALVVSVWMRFAFEAITLHENRMEFRDWRSRHHHFSYSAITAFARRWTRRRGRRTGPRLFLHLSAPDMQDHWISLPKWFWPDGRREALEREIIRRCGLTEMVPNPAVEEEDDITWQRPGTG